MSTSVKLYATRDGKSVNTTFSAINPNATDAELKSAAQALNTLTENTYAKSEKITTVELDSAVAKLTPTLKVNDAADPLTRTTCLAGVSPLIDYTGDGELWIAGNNDNTSWVTTFRVASATNTLRLYIGVLNEASQAAATAPHQIVIRSDETDTYAAGEFVITILADE